MYRATVCRSTERRNRRGRRFARKSDSGNQTWDVAEAAARTNRFRLDIFSCIGGDGNCYDPRMRPPAVTKALAITAVVAAGALALPPPLAPPSAPFAPLRPGGAAP